MNRLGRAGLNIYTIYIQIYHRKGRCSGLCVPGSGSPLWKLGRVIVKSNESVLAHARQPAFTATTGKQAALEVQTVGLERACSIWIPPNPDCQLASSREHKAKSRGL